MTTTSTGTVQQAALQVVTNALDSATKSIDLVSPFLSNPVAKRLSAQAKQSPARWRLLTNLDPRAIAAGVLQLAGLRDLIDHGVEVRTVARLHAKVVLVDDTFGIVGSANLTTAGLEGPPNGNFELGVTLDVDQREAAAAVVAGWWAAATQVDDVALKQAEAAARALPKTVHSVDELPPGSGATSAIATQLLVEARDRGLWVKAVYDDGTDPSWPERGWISSSGPGKPSFKSGDFVLIYAQGLHRCNAIVEVTSPARFDPDFVEAAGYPRENAERWPWVNDVRGLLAVEAGEAVPPALVGFSAQGLQGGRKKLDLAQFAAAAQYLAGRRDLQ
jgi:hypothetical protein